MKKTLIVAAITAVSIASVNTALAADDSMYFGASYDLMKAKVKGQDFDFSEKFNSGNVSLKLGKNFTKNFGLEAVYGLNANDSSKELFEQQGPKFSAYTKNYYGLYLTGALPLTESFSLTSKLGYVRAKNELKASYLGDSVVFNDTGSSISWGVGGAYKLTQSVDLTLDYTSLYSGTLEVDGDKADFKVRGFMFGAKYSF